jgi:hypothetical protein
MVFHQFINILNSLGQPLENAAERLLQNWNAIEKYFLIFIPKEKSNILTTKSHQKIRNLLNISTIKCEILFVCSSAKVFTKFTGSLQKGRTISPYYV